MADISKIQVESGVYNIKDEVARNTNLIQIKSYETVQAMFNDIDNLNINDIVETRGYYYHNDGGKAQYIVRPYSISLLERYLGFFIAPENQTKKMFTFIYGTEINIKQLGAKEFRQNNNKLFDIKPYLQSYYNRIQYITNLDYKTNFKLIIPSGVWGCSPFEFKTSGKVVDNNIGVDIEGISSYYNMQAVKGTYICSMTDIQSYIWALGITKEYSNFSIKNITFTTCTPSKVITIFEYSNIKTITDCCLRLQNCSFGLFENIEFYNIKGKAMCINSCWELTWVNLVLQNISNLNNYIVSFETRDTSLNPNANISDCKWDYIRCEALHGSIFEFQQNCVFVHNDIFAIHFEDYSFAPVGNIILSNYATFNDSTRPTFNEDTADHESIFVFQAGAYVANNTIHSLSLNNFSYRMLTVNGVQHSFDTIMKFLGDNAVVDLNFNSISIWGVNKKGNIILSKGHKIYRNTNIIISNFATNSEYRFNFNVEQFTSIVSHSNLFNTYNSTSNYLNNNACAFYDSLHNTSSSTRGLLYYDEDSQTQNKLVVIPETVSENSTNRTFASGIMTGRYLNICAKIPNGVTKTITVSNTSLGVYKNLALEGTGAFKIYQVDVNIPFGSTFDITISSQDAGDTNSRFDYWFQTGEPTV